MTSHHAPAVGTQVNCSSPLGEPGVQLMPTVSFRPIGAIAQQRDRPLVLMSFDVWGMGLVWTASATGSAALVWPLLVRYADRSVWVGILVSSLTFISFLVFLVWQRPQLRSVIGLRFCFGLLGVLLGVLHA